MPPRISKSPYTSPAAFLGEQLGIARVAAGYPTHDAMAKAIGTDRSTITKAESGDRPPTATVLEQVLDACGITGQLRKVFEGLALLARVKEDGPVKIWFAGWLDAEGKSHTLRIWQPVIFPGLLQTQAYARDIFRAMGMSDEQAQEHVQARLRRHAVFDREDFPNVIVVLDESLLYRLIGTPEIMRGQLAHVIELSQRPNVMIHVLPSRVGANAGLGGSIHLAAGTGAPEVLLVGSLIEDQVTTDATLVRRASATYDMVRCEALSRSESRVVLTEALERWNSN
jgi:transcriptional regulator with XRE-family HTH domain